ncbi:glycosyltransferase family 4 protein [Andreprevotia chitinilytica]|uniref:glycosyltransferase family 4 protein n=1 Tax=Andreprevotia chitinilytica TaxID=396808 RepID=UPI000550A4CD|nr:glycosyltransferase family 4 protein [Andreprevotia chitinilytica]
MPSPARRIALILTEFPPHFGGMQTHAIHLAAHLQAAGHDIEVFTYRSDDLHAAAADFDTRCGYVVQRVLSRIGFWHNQHLLLRRLRAFQPDVIYASNVYYGLLGPALGVPVICRSVGNDVLRPWIVYPFRLGSGFCAWPSLESLLYRSFRRCNSPEWIEALFRRTRLKLMQRTACANTHILANSDYTIHALQTIGVAASHLSTLPGGVDCRRFQPIACDRVALRQRYGLPADARVLFTACRFVAKKGIDFLLQQLPVLLKRHANTVLLIAGDGPERNRCEQLAAELGITGQVRFVGRVEHGEIEHCYWLSDLFVLASRITRNPVSGLIDAETMGRVLCEANAAGVPVLASNSGGIPSVIRHEDNGLLFAEDNAADFLLQFERLTADDALRAQLVARGLARAAREFDWVHLLAAHDAAFAVACDVSARASTALQPAIS